MLLQAAEEHSERERERAREGEEREIEGKRSKQSSELRHVVAK